MKQCPKCTINMDYLYRNPFIHYNYPFIYYNCDYNCISNDYDEREYYRYFINTTKTDSYLENRLSELKKEYEGVNNDDKRN